MRLYTPDGTREYVTVSGRGRGRGVRLRPGSRMTGWRAVHEVMVAAGLEGPQASPKGLRHGFRGGGGVNG